MKKLTIFIFALKPMFTFSILVSIVQDKDLELSYCVPSVRMIGSSRIVVISQDTTFLQLQAIILCLFLSVYFLFSFGMAGDEKKRKWRNPKGPPKPHTVGASHCSMDINKWKESDMKMYLDKYKRQLAATNNIKELVNRAEIARIFGISPCTLHHRVSLS